MRKVCLDCKVEKSSTEFYFQNRQTGGLQSRCKPCMRAVSAEHYKKNRAARLRAGKQCRHRLMKWFQNYKKTLACQHCGFSHPAALHFHHRDPSQKSHPVGAMVSFSGKPRILKEIAKCDVLCANCHAIHHYQPLT